MIRKIHNKHGISRVIEFSIVFIVFIVIVTGFIGLARIWLTPQEINYNYNTALTISTILVKSSGYLRIDDNTFVTNWQDYPPYYDGYPNINDNLTYLGFADDADNILNITKIIAVGKLTYTKLRTVLGLQPWQNVNISITTINTISNSERWSFSFGVNYTGKKNLAEIRRICMLYNPFTGNYTLAELYIWVFDGGEFEEKIVINEVMYAPVGDDEPNEWVELYNPSNMAIDINKWLIGNWNTDDTINWVYLTNWNDEKRGTVIPSNGFAIIPSGYYKDDIKRNYTYCFDAIWLEQKRFDGDRATRIADRMLITPEKIILKNKYHEIVDSVSFDSSVGGYENNESIERITPWSSSLAESSSNGHNGTLGRKNTVSNYGCRFSVSPDNCTISDISQNYVLYNITIMNNDNKNLAIILYNFSKSRNVRINYISGGLDYWQNNNTLLLAAINKTDNISEIYANFSVNITVDEFNPGEVFSTVIYVVNEKNIYDIEECILITRVT